ncbi:MAG: hypothetical protein MI742_03450 [Desulfobacterales bacterium]|nr:hypothetical protein [Desulfobacterales bacterium]
MIPLQKLELVLVVCAGVVALFLSPLLPLNLSVGRLIIELSALLLFQNLLRELALLVGRGKEVLPEVPRAGLGGLTGGLGLVVGWILFATNPEATFYMAPWKWALAITGSLFMGYLLRDLMLTKTPFFISYEKGHAQVTF